VNSSATAGGTSPMPRGKGECWYIIPPSPQFKKFLDFKVGGD